MQVGPHIALSIDKMHLNIILNRQVTFPFLGKQTHQIFEVQERKTVAKQTRANILVNSIFQIN